MKQHLKSQSPHVNLSITNYAWRHKYSMYILVPFQRSPCSFFIGRMYLHMYIPVSLTFEKTTTFISYTTNISISLLFLGKCTKIMKSKLNLIFSRITDKIFIKYILYSFTHYDFITSTFVVIASVCHGQTKKPREHNGWAMYTFLPDLMSKIKRSNTDNSLEQRQSEQ